MTELILNKLKIEKALNADWNLILEILNETGLRAWFTGAENYSTFYTVKDIKSNKTIACFSVELENDIGILKSFAVRKELQGTGLGRHIANKVSDVAGKLGLKKVYASSWEASQFWIKTHFKKINKSDSTDEFFLRYVDDLDKQFPQFAEKTKHFLLVI